MAETPAVDDIWKAAAYGDLDKTKEYLDTGENVNKPDATGCVFAISSPAIREILRVLVRTTLRDADDPDPVPERLRRLLFLRRFLPLQWAALNNRVAVATYLIEKGAAVNATDKDKRDAAALGVRARLAPVRRALLAPARASTRRTAAGTTPCTSRRSTDTRA